MAAAPPDRDAVGGGATTLDAVFGLITGSGFYDVPDLEDRHLIELDTPFGGPVSVTTGTWDGVRVGFIPRHGRDHLIPPHAINYRANVAALKAVGVTSILATAVSGGIDPAMTPGSLVVISDFLDFTSGREATFFDGTGRPLVADGPPSRAVTHTDMSAPYHSALRATIVEAARIEAIPVIDGGVYCTADGPRFETPAEIRMMRAAGGDLVGMTGYPEVALAVEAGLPYASIGVISNPAAGLGVAGTEVAGAGPAPLSVEDIMAIVETTVEPLYRLIGRTVALVGGGGIGD